MLFSLIFKNTARRIKNEIYSFDTIAVEFYISTVTLNKKLENLDKSNYILKMQIVFPI